MPNFMPFQFFGSRLSLWRIDIVMAWPLMFWIVATLVGTALEPRPMLMASGMGERKCEASYSLLITLSRTSAQPAVLVTSTLRPCFS
ncbi:hypothetical protein FQZ97_883210 [compost metagenome]